MTRKKHSKAERPHEAEVSVLPRGTWESLKGLLEVFEEALQEASELSKAPGDDAGRVAALKSLEAVLDLIELLYPENRQELSGPIFQTYQALLGLQKGATPKGAAPHPLLIPKSIEGRPPTRPEVERVKAEAAAAMELFMDAGDSKDEAARKVFRRIRHIDLESFGYTARRNTARDNTGITPNTIAGWRDNFTGAAGNSIGAERFRIILGYEIVKNQSPKSAATWILESLLGSTLPENRDNPLT